MSTERTNIDLYTNNLSAGYPSTDRAPQLLVLPRAIRRELNRNEHRE